MSEKSELKIFTIKDIRSWMPCYDPIRHLPEGWSGTVLDILKNKEIPIQDRFWVVLREELLPSRFLRLFAVWCARQVQHLMKDERSIAALDVAEKYAKGEVGEEELKEARAAAVAAAWAAGCAVADAAARAAGDADESAAVAAAWAGQTKLKKLIEMIEEVLNDKFR